MKSNIPAQGDTGLMYFCAKILPAHPGNTRILDPRSERGVRYPTPRYPQQTSSSNNGSALVEEEVILLLRLWHGFIFGLAYGSVRDASNVVL